MNQRQRVREMCRRRGIRIEQVRPGLYRLRGGGVDLLTTDLRFVGKDDLEPLRSTMD